MGKKSKRKTKTKPPVAVDDVTITSDEALFKDPPAKEDCPICFLPMPVNLISCASLIDRAMYEEDETMKETLAQLYRNYQSKTWQMQMRSWQKLV